MTTRMKVIIDTDVDFDDYMAIVYLLQNPRVEVIAIGVTGCGAAHLTHGLSNVANLLTLFGKREQSIPILKGGSAPLRYSNVFPASVRKDADCHYDAVFPGVNPSPNIVDAQDWLKQFFLSSDERVTVLSIGGGTNFGKLFVEAKADAQLQRSIKRGIDKIVMMGGNLLPEYISPGAGGNIIPTLGDDPYYTNKVAEWNIFIDPLGAKIMFEFGVPISLIALNATNEVPIEQSFIDRLNAIDTPQAKFISQILAFPANAAGVGTYLSFWDPLAACTITDSTLVTTQTFNIVIQQELDEENDQSAKLIVDNVNGSPIAIAVAASKDAVYEEYLRVIALPDM